MAMGKRPSVWLKELIGSGVDLMLVCGEREARPIRQGTSEKTMSNLLAPGRNSSSSTSRASTTACRSRPTASGSGRG